MGHGMRPFSKIKGLGGFVVFQVSPGGFPRVLASGLGFGKASSVLANVLTSCTLTRNRCILLIAKISLAWGSE